MEQKNKLKLNSGRFARLYPYGRCIWNYKHRNGSSGDPALDSHNF